MFVANRENTANSEKSTLVYQIKKDKPVIVTVTTDMGTTSTEIPFQVADIDEGRLQVQLRVPLANVRVALIDPENRQVVSPDDSKTIVQAGAITQHPELGDLFILPEQKDPIPGFWRLRLTHSPSAGTERVSVTTTLLERFQLNMISSGNDFHVGEEVMLSVLATDYGQPVTKLSPRIEVRANGKPIAPPLLATENNRAPTGIPLSSEPGLYIAKYSFQSPDTFELLTSIEFTGRRGKIIKTANMTVEISPSVVSLSPLRAEAVRASKGCVEKIEFITGLSAQESGTYTVSLFLQGMDNREIELSATQESNNGVLWYRISLDAAEVASQLEQEWATAIKRIDVLRFDDQGAKLERRYEGEKALPSIATKELCHPKDGGNR
jgi:hypothetical protein